MILYLIVIFVVSIRGSIQLEYDCLSDGSMNITNPDETRFKFFDMTVSMDNNGCHGNFSEDYSHLLLKDCTMGERINIVFLGDNSGILKKGNYAGPYNIICQQIPPGGIEFEIKSILFVRDNTSIPTETVNITGSLIITKLRGVRKLAIRTIDAGLKWLVDVPEHLLDLLCLKRANSTTESATSAFTDDFTPVPTVGDIGNTAEPSIDLNENGITSSNMEQEVATDDESLAVSSTPIRLSTERLPTTLVTSPSIEDITAVYAETSVVQVGHPKEQ
ncbi:uncharacterized protein LOC123545040 isoform X1 [Mercenaria mercenaria]|uniref:uncharacterized protein LOC123545040 isoform X1 n=1 Tax=Mercenaria mercenaria TaxID=6596 RepID=UPI00234EDE22|nr:uncharacterized protein LOC123545040 isoform X1 [Mercenaria mercenaria]